jgi:hypothetical protein
MFGAHRLQWSASEGCSWCHCCLAVAAIALLLARVEQTFRGNATVINASTKAFFNARVSARARSTVSNAPTFLACRISIDVNCFGIDFISPQSYRIQTANQLQFVMMIVGSMKNSNKCAVAHVHSRANSKSSSIGS